jgi:hypothetical protein
MEYREIKLGVKTGSKIIIVLLLTDIIIESRIIKSLLSFPHTKNASGFSEAFFFNFMTDSIAINAIQSRTLIVCAILVLIVPYTHRSIILWSKV